MIDCFRTTNDVAEDAVDALCSHQKQLVYSKTIVTSSTVLKTALTVWAEPFVVEAMFDGFGLCLGLTFFRFTFSEVLPVMPAHSAMMLLAYFD